MHERIHFKHWLNTNNMNSISNEKERKKKSERERNEDFLIKRERERGIFGITSSLKKKEVFRLDKNGTKSNL